MEEQESSRDTGDGPDFRWLEGSVANRCVPSEDHLDLLSVAHNLMYCIFNPA